MTANELDPYTRAAFDFLMQQPTHFEVDEKLRELMMDSMRLHPAVIAIWLRLTYTYQDKLQSWQPLLNAGMSAAREQGISGENCFYGLLPRQSQPQMNTGQPTPGPHPWNAAVRR